MDNNNQTNDKSLAKANPGSQVTKWDQPLNLNKLTVTQMRFMGQAMADSGMFPDIQKDSAKAMVKILAGQEIGVTPFQAMSNINIIQGKAAMGANLMAAKVKGSGKYDYRADISSDKCSITMKQLVTGKWEDIGSYTFSMADAKRIGLANKDNWVKYPQNMLFARAISNAVRMYAPDVFNGNLVYDPDELSDASAQPTITDPELDFETNEAIDSAKASIEKVKSIEDLTELSNNMPQNLQLALQDDLRGKLMELTDGEGDDDNPTE
jgi:hypothetical protein